MRLMCYSAFVVSIIFGGVGLHFAETPLEGFWFGLIAGVIGVASLRAAVSRPMS